MKPRRCRPAAPSRHAEPGLPSSARARRVARASESAAPAGRSPQTTASRQRRRRSEEHTSELQSLMRISYAVFCLKKKMTKKEDKLNNTPNLTKQNITDTQINPVD